MKALKASGLNTGLTADGLDGASNMTVRMMPDGNYNISLKGQNVAPPAEGKIATDDSGTAWVVRGGQWQKMD